jgi:DNA-binding SARP family transcriptional activator
MKKTLYFLFIIYIPSIASILQANAIEYGLFIKSHPLKDAEKTSLILENGKPLKFFKETSLTFDLFVRPENPFGIILRMVTDKNENMDLFIALGEDNNYYLMLVINESLYLMQKSILLEQWMPVSISFSSSKNELTLSGQESKLSVPYTISQIESAKISFGLCLFPNFSLYDVASVNIRNIKVYNNDKLFRYWKLDEHKEDLSFDTVANVPAITNNSKWIVDDYSRWTQFYSKQVKVNSLYAFDNCEEKLYIIPDDQRQFIYIYDLKTGTENIVRAKNKHTASSSNSRLLYDNLQDKLIIYNLEDQSTFIFSFKQLVWEYNGKTSIPEDFGYYNHSSVYSVNDSLLYSFGGYGYLKYNNVLVALNVYNDSITRILLPEITPRFYSSTIKIDNLLYIFGGKGSKTGRQEIFPRHYIDLYAVNLITGQTTQLWSMNEINANFYLGENMIYDETEKCFYAITDMEDLTLVKVTKEQEGYEKMSFFSYDSLYRKAFYRNLFLSSDKQKLYTLVVRNPSDDQLFIELYSLQYPPIQVNSQIINPQKGKAKSFLHYFVVGFVLLFGLFLIFFLKRRKVNREMQAQNPRFEFKSPEDIKITHYDFSKQSICFLGEFSIINGKAINITNQFTPILTDILLLLILNLEQGVANHEFDKQLWYDKSNDAARNNRNVYFSRFRVILNDIGDIEFVKNSGRWKILPGEKVNCDYKEALAMLSKIKKQQYNDVDIEKLLEILSRGPLLPNIEVDWVDKFKREFSNQVIDVLTDLSKNNIYLSEDIKLKIANLLSMHDYLSEEALYLKCSVFLRSGKKGIAKNIYENFCKEYFELLRVDYKYSFPEIIHRTNIS